jgi:hypothetical protein
VPRDGARPVRAGARRRPARARLQLVAARRHQALGDGHGRHLRPYRAARHAALRRAYAPAQLPLVLTPCTWRAGTATTHACVWTLVFIPGVGPPWGKLGVWWLSSSVFLFSVYYKFSKPFHACLIDARCGVIIVRKCDILYVRNPRGTIVISSKDTPLDLHPFMCIYIHEHPLQ